MTKIRKIYGSAWEKWAKKSIFGQNGQILAKNGQKIENNNFSRNFFRHFLKDQKIGSYGKNQENL